jgi:hypothetical protein
VTNVLLLPIQKRDLPKKIRYIIRVRHNVAVPYIHDGDGIWDSRAKNPNDVRVIDRVRLGLGLETHNLEMMFMFETMSILVAIVCFETVSNDRCKTAQQN